MMKNFFYKLLLSVLVLASSHSLYAHVELDNPKGGETFVGGTTVTVTWHITIAHVTLNWDLLISTDGGTTWDYIQENIPPGNLSYQWQVPNLNSTHVRISIIQDNEGQDYQDESNDFTIQSSITSVPTIPDSYFQLYPNPVIDFLNVDLSNNIYWPAKLELFTSAGSSVWNVSDAGKKIRIDLNSLSPGLYFLCIETSQGISTRKVIIQKT